MTIDRVKIGKVRRCFVDGVQISADALFTVMIGTMDEESACKAWQTLLEKGTIVINKHSEANAEAPFICPTCKQEVSPF